MKKYRVVVNGTEYEVGVELLGEDEVAAPAPVKPEASAPAPAVPAAASGDGEVVKSPMPGTILSVKVADGTAVTKGQVLMVLEAMKMENEIVAPVAGVVNGLSVVEGAAVESGAKLCVIA
ncbi:biotin/lipoyl-containing protein [Eubacterium barkeri]|uniref:Biotin-requiring enzyme n=1 Tax=Eubacterium barkeri TaxID=1528 RepID=A0A1H3AVS0_EUBBA|nr:biotin/lipoyl-containing protein [Eubacterium barkeri]SDX33695.1 Biotin-requiring enzyme [Eubacterium barkeri]